MAPFHFHLLFRKPLVAVGNGGNELDGTIAYLAKIASGRAAHLFFKLTWTADVQVGAMQYCQDKWKSLAPNIQLTAMTSSEADADIFRNLNLDVICCHHNCFLSERVIYPDPVAEKRYDAVYVARLTEFKRHYLAANVPRLALASSTWNVRADYVNQVRSALPSLACLNADERGYVQQLKVCQVQELLVQSHCGLALSEIEGGMYASGEYLLAGLPVVSTPSLGGRDEFFHPDYVRIVDATPESVALAVREFINHPPDPCEIRRRTLERMKIHRLNLVRRLSEILQRDLIPFTDACGWLPQFSHQNFGWAPMTFATDADLATLTHSL